ncbi:MAG: sulfurtransferase TusA family protein [Nitrospinae bacterium]|nr:sulfurtransferase TusA family protein [Nitrospinota bacterium]
MSVQFTLGALAEANRAALAAFADKAAAFMAGEILPDDFTHDRVEMGVYSQRKAGSYMIRTKVPAGIVDAAGLRAVAAVAKAHGNGTAHLSTRQNFQIHHLAFEGVMPTLTTLLDGGIATLGAGGATIRNLNACDHGSGILGDALDIAPLARAVGDRLMATEFAMALPRKLKIGFCGLPGGCGAVVTEDLGVALSADADLAAPTFDLYAGGGQGAQPRLGVVLDRRIPQEQVLAALLAALAVFKREGKGASRAKARLKFLIERIGADQYRAFYKEEKQRYLSGATLESPTLRKADGSRVVLAPVNADLTAAQLEGIADHLPDREGVTTRITKEGRLVIDGLKGSEIAKLQYAANELLIPLTLDERSPRVLTCNGAATCREAFTNAKGFGVRLTEAADRLFAGQAMAIRVSGCPNACANSHTADIGFMGGYRKFHGESTPIYNVVIGGVESKTDAKVAMPIGRIPAKRGIAVMEALAATWREWREGDESFGNTVGRVGVEPFRDAIGELVDVTEEDVDAQDILYDWDTTERLDLRDIGPGECGGAAREIVESALDAARSAKRHGRLAEATRQTGAAILAAAGVELADDAKVAPLFEERAKLAADIRRTFMPLLVWLDRGAPEGETPEEKRVSSFIDIVAIHALGTAAPRPASKSAVAPEPTAEIKLLDLSGVSCPFNYVKAKIALEMMAAGALLKIALDDGAPITNVPSSLGNDGHEIVEKVKNGAGWLLTVKRAA